MLIQNVDQEEPVSMVCRSLSSLAAVALTLSLAACGGGSSGGNSVAPGGGQGPSPGSVSIAPNALSFASGASPSQTFTLNSSVPGVATPAIDPFGCGSVATLSTTSTTLPAVYTVTPQGNGTCTFVVNFGHQSATLGITVGGGANPIITGGGTVSLFVGGTSGSVSVNASSGTLVPDTNACAGIASITANAGNSATAQTYTIAPASAGSCVFSIVDGASSVSVPIGVSSTATSAGVFVSPTAMTIASPHIDPFTCPNPGSTCADGPALPGTISFTGSVGQVSIDEHECLGAPPIGGPNTMAFMTIPGSPPNPVSLPTNFTVNSYGNKIATCHIFINPQFGTGATLTVTTN